MKQHYLYGLALLSLTYAACDDDEVPNNLDPDLPCEVAPGTLAGGPYAFTTDGLEDRLTGLSVSGGEGPRRSFVLADGSGDIVRVYSSADALAAEDLDALPAGDLQVFYVTYQIGLEGLTAGGNITALEGCSTVSSPIGIPRVPCPTEGGVLTAADGTVRTFSIDGAADNVDAGAFTIEGASGERSAYLLTDTGAVVLGIYPNIDSVAAVDLETLTDQDTVLLWYAAIDGELRGDTVGATPAEIQGCIALSDSIVLTRECRAFGGRLSGGPIVFSVDDEEDRIEPDRLSLSAAVGTAMTYVVTDAEGIILGLPPTLEALGEVDFNAAGEGICLVWHLSANTELTGDSIGGDATALGGCYDLSNPVEVRRNCDALGGRLQGGPFVFDVDSAPDFVSDITITVSDGDSTTYVVTDANGIILELPPTLEALEGVDFNAAGVGTCLIWHLSANTEVTGDSIGGDAMALGGCYDLSNPLEVVRVCPADGGTLTGGPFEFEVDGMRDTVSGIALEDAAGEAFTYVVTDTAGIILGLPPTLEALEGVDFDAAGEGTCLIWHLSTSGEVTGDTLGGDATALEGCYELSNALTVTRN